MICLTTPVANLAHLLTKLCFVTNHLTFFTLHRSAAHFAVAHLVGPSTAIAHCLTLGGLFGAESFELFPLGVPFGEVSVLFANATLHFAAWDGTLCLDVISITSPTNHLVFSRIIIILMRTTALDTL